MVAPPPSVNVTVSPFGIVPELGETIAVNVTDCPRYDGFREELTVVDVGSWFTTDWLSVGEVLARLFASPEYCAVIEREPVVANDVVNDARLPTRLTVPRFVRPLRKVTDPDTASGAETVAVNVMGWFTSCGFIDETRPVEVVAFVPELLTTCDRTAEVAAAKFVSPEYDALME